MFVMNGVFLDLMYLKMDPYSQNSRLWRIRKCRCMTDATGPQQAPAAWLQCNALPWGGTGMQQQWGFSFVYIHG